MFFLTKNINSEEFYKIRNSEDVIIIDVRTPEEFSMGKIEGAINISYPSDNFKIKISEFDKGKKCLVYCRSGNRSSFACVVMKNLGFKNAYNLKGGIIDWIRNSKPVVE
jgi:rhodanese-related sulfurtransferase